jgi:hypothetical protein
MDYSSTFDPYTYNCISPTTYSATDSLTQTMSWVAAAVDATGWDGSYPILDCPNVATITVNATYDNYTVSQFSYVQYQSTALIPHQDTNINNTNLIEKYYMMFDASYTFTPTCPTGTLFCPTYTVDCNPPYDWSPKSYKFNLAIDTSPASYDAPLVRDCLGRYLTVYDAGNTLRLPGGNGVPGDD